MSILTKGITIAISKEAHTYLISQKIIAEEPIHRVLGRILEIKKETKP